MIGRVGAALGVALVVATGCGSESTTFPTHGDRRVISGRLVTAGDVGSMTRVKVAVRSELDSRVQEFSGTANADGTFRFEAELPSGERDSVDFIVDVDEGPRPFAPIYKRIAASDSESYRRPLVIARNIVIAAGTHAGSTMPVTLVGAFAPICPDSISLSCRGFFGLWPEVPLLWADDAFPIPLAFFRRAGEPDITPDDSVVFWTNVASLEADFGRDLFRPADIGALGVVSPTGLPQRGTAVSIDRSVQPALGGAASENGRLVLGRARANNIAWLRQKAVMNHELIHVLGFGHTCTWESLMCGVELSRTTTPRGDVAAFLLAYLIDNAVRTQAPTTTILDAVRGETYWNRGQSLIQ